MNKRSETANWGRRKPPQDLGKLVLQFRTFETGPELVATEYSDSIGSTINGPTTLRQSQALRALVQLLVNTKCDPHFFLRGKLASCLRDATRADKRPPMWVKGLFGQASSEIPARVVRIKRTKGETLAAVADPLFLDSFLQIVVDDNDISLDKQALQSLARDLLGEDVLRSPQSSITLKIQDAKIGQVHGEEILKAIRGIVGEEPQILDVKAGCIEVTVQVSAAKSQIIPHSLGSRGLRTLGVSKAWQEFPVPQAPTAWKFKRDIKSCRVDVDRFALVKSYFKTMIATEGSVVFKERLNSQTLENATDFLIRWLENIEGIQSEPNKIERVVLYPSPLDHVPNRTSSELNFFPTY